MDSVTDGGRTSKPEPIRLNGRVIGESDGRTARFFVTERHWFKAGNGYSLDQQILEGLEGHADRIEFIDRKARTRESIPFDVFAANSWPTPDYGFGRKIVCPARFYDSRRATASAQAGLPGLGA